MNNYPFILGAQAVRMIDLAPLYAAIASEGARFQPSAIDSIESNGLLVYRRPPAPPTMLAGGDRVAFYQLRTLLEGVVARGTATRIKAYAGFVGGKTGTTENENDSGLPDLPATSRSLFGSAMTMQTAGARWARARPAVQWPFRSRTKSCKRLGRIRLRKFHCRRRRPKRSRRMKAFPIDVATGNRTSGFGSLHGIFPARRKRPADRYAARSGRSPPRAYRGRAIRARHARARRISRRCARARIEPALGMGF